MTVAEITRNLSYITLTNYSPFIYVGTTKYYTLRDEWTNSVDDIFTTTTTKVKAKQVTRDYLNKYIEEETLADCEIQEGSFYFDKATQQIYIHIEHEYSPLTANIDYGYAFGVCSQSMDFTYIDDYEYEPVINDELDISRTADAIGSSQPTGSSSSLQLINAARFNELAGEQEGILDFMFDENLYNNDVFIYDYKDGIATAKAVFYIEDWGITETTGSLNLQDKRFS